MYTKAFQAKGAHQKGFYRKSDTKKVLFVKKLKKHCSRWYYLGLSLIISLVILEL